MESSATRISWLKADPPYTMEACTCGGRTFHVLAGHGYTDVIVCETCARIQLTNHDPDSYPDVVRRSASARQPDDTMRRHAILHESDNIAAAHVTDHVSDRGEARHGTTSEVHTRHDAHAIRREFAANLLGFAYGYAYNHDDGTAVSTEAIHFALIDYLTSYTTSDGTG